MGTGLTSATPAGPYQHVTLTVSFRQRSLKLYLYILNIILKGILIVGKSSSWLLPGTWHVLNTDMTDPLPCSAHRWKLCVSDFMFRDLPRNPYYFTAVSFWRKREWLLFALNQAFLILCFLDTLTGTLFYGLMKFPLKELLKGFFFLLLWRFGC